MGRKQTGPWKYFFYSVACLIFLSLLHCAAIEELRRREEAKKALQEGHRYLSKGCYEEALNEYHKVLVWAAQKPPEDEALFHIGLIYASSRYPKRDTKRSMEFFAAVLNQWPRSPLAEQAKIWLGVLYEGEKMNLLVKKMGQQETKPPEKKPPEKKVNDDREGRDFFLRSQRLLAAKDFEGFVSENQKVLSLSHPRAPKDEALFNLGLAYAHEGNPKKDFSKSLLFFERLVHEHPKSPLAEQAKIWVGLLQEHEALSQLLQKLKQIDIEVEEKKREKSK